MDLKSKEAALNSMSDEQLIRHDELHQKYGKSPLDMSDDELIGMDQRESFSKKPWYEKIGAMAKGVGKLIGPGEDPGTELGSFGEIFSPTEKQKEGMKAFGRGAAEAATFGYLPNILAAVEPGDYEQNKMAELKQREEYEKSYPLSYGRGNLGGALALGAGGGKLLSMLKGAAPVVGGVDTAMTAAADTGLAGKAMNLGYKTLSATAKGAGYGAAGAALQNPASTINPSSVQIPMRLESAKEMIGPGVALGAGGGFLEQLGKKMYSVPFSKADAQMKLQKKTPLSTTMGGETGQWIGNADDLFLAGQRMTREAGQARAQLYNAADAAGAKINMADVVKKPIAMLNEKIKNSAVPEQAKLYRAMKDEILDIGNQGYKNVTQVSSGKTFVGKNVSEMARSGKDAMDEVEHVYSTLQGEMRSAVENEVGSKLGAGAAKELRDYNRKMATLISSRPEIARTVLRESQYNLINPWDAPIEHFGGPGTLALKKGIELGKLTAPATVSGGMVIRGGKLLKKAGGLMPGGYKKEEK